MDPTTLMLCILFSMPLTHIHTYRHSSPLGSFTFYQHTSPLLLVTTLLVLSLHIALTHIHTYRHSSPLVSFAPSLSTNTLHHCCYPSHIQRFPALPHHAAYILVSVFVSFSWMVFFFTLKMGHARKFGAFNLYLILFVFFGSEVNICSEETVVGEFEVRYPIMCEWLQWNLRVLRKAQHPSFK